MKKSITIEKFNSQGILIESVDKEIEVPPDWIQFQLLFTTDSAYDEINRITSNQSACRRFEILVNKQTEELNILAWQWQGMLGGLIQEDKDRILQPSVVVKWNQIANDSAMDFIFTDLGLIENL